MPCGLGVRRGSRVRRMARVVGEGLRVFNVYGVITRAWVLTNAKSIPCGVCGVPQAVGRMKVYTG